MELHLIIAFITTTFFFVVIPGPSVAFATAQALKHGARGAYVTVAGDALGTIVHILIAASSLTFLIAASELILPPLQIAGGIFIIFLAYRSFRIPQNTNNGQQLRSGDKATFWAGFFACVSNPKAIMFFVALFPAFISPEHSILIQSLVYGAIFLVMDMVSILAFSLLTLHSVNRAKSRLINTNILVGLGLTGVGLAMIVSGYRTLQKTQ
ncbi:MAG: LysE family translocator [Pseudomonadota bacterium]